jgi:hypothetical protein
MNVVCCMAEAQRSARARPLEAQVAFGLAPRDLQKKRHGRGSSWDMPPGPGLNGSDSFVSSIEKIVRKNSLSS